MNNLVKLIFQVLLVVFAAVLLCLCLTPLLLVELFLVLLGALIIARVGILAAQEAAELLNLVDEHKYEQEIRELKLRRVRRQPLLLDRPCKWLMKRHTF